MRRYMDMNKLNGQAGMMSNMPTMYNLVVNGNSPIIAKMLKMKGEDRRQTYAKQLHDLALLSQGMLSGGNLTDFVNRTFEEMS